MKIKLKHNFVLKSHDIDNLLTDVYKLNSFLYKLEKQSKISPNTYDPDKYKGDGFELFVEALIKLMPINNRFGVMNYKPIQKNDYGADGKGIGLNGKPATVQVKFRSDSRYYLTANKDHLSNFVTASQNDYGVDVEDTKNMIIITCAAGVDHKTLKNMLKNKVVVVNRKELQSLVDNNHIFWDLFRQLVKERKEAVQKKYKQRIVV